MTSYVRKSYFKDIRPQNLLPRIPVRREKVLKKLVRNRGSIKYLYAPSGYGKSSLAYDYIDYIHNWREAFWFDCNSACFKRDVESKEIVDKMLEICTIPSVVVFDDLVELKGKFKQSFTKVLSRLVDLDCDIVITQNSIMYDATAFNLNTTYIFGQDLCMTEEEARGAKMYGTYDDFDFSHHVNCQCPPCLIFDRNGVDDLMISCRTSKTDSVETAAIYLIYLFKRGYVFDLYRFIDEDLLKPKLQAIAAKYPHIGFDSDMMTFETISVHMDILGDGFKDGVDLIVDGTKFETRDKLFDEIMDKMCEDELISEAYDFVKNFGNERDLSSFATHEFSNMLKNNDFTIAYDCLSKIESNWLIPNHTSNFYKSCLYAYIRDNDRYLDIVSNLDKSDPVDGCFYIPCKLMNFAYLLEESDIKELEWIKKFLSGNKLSSSPYFDDISLQFDIESCRWLCSYLIAEIKSPFDALNMLAQGVLNLNVGEDLDFKLKTYSRRHPSDIAGICLAYVHVCLRLLEGSRQGLTYEESFIKYIGEDLAEESKRIFENITELMVALYDERVYVKNVPWQLMDVLLRMEDIWGAYKQVSDCFDNIDLIDVMFAVDNFKESAERLRVLIRKKEGEQNKNNKSVCFNDSKKPRISLVESKSINEVEISIFNSLNIRINSEIVPFSKISTKKGKYLLGLLAIANFREVPRDMLIGDLFTLERIEKSSTRSNFYAMISRLKDDFKKYGIEDWLIKNTLGYKYNEEIVTTDFDGFDLLVNNFMFNVGCTDSWEEPYSRLKDRFSRPAFEALTGNKVIDSFRVHSTNRLVDALLGATGRLIDRDDTFGALTLARQALELDDKREDVYVALMKSQSLAQQRSQAIETFFECKKFLSKELGIAPSKALLDEYEKLII